jgi:opacity protein-like surface antigen
MHRTSTKDSSVKKIIGSVGLALFVTTASWGNEWLLSDQLKDGFHVGLPVGGDIYDQELELGYQAVYEHNENMSIEFDVTRQTDKLPDQEISGGLLPFDTKTELELWGITLSGRLSFKPLDSMSLFAGAGAGYYIFKADDQNLRKAFDASGWDDGGAYIKDVKIDLNNDFGTHLMAGLEWRFAERWELFADYRIVFLGTEESTEITREYPQTDPHAPGDWIKTTTTIPFDYNFSLLRAGINFRF